MIDKSEYITGNRFKELATCIIHGQPVSITLNSSNNIFFVKTDYLPTFKQDISPYITYPYILITHNSDHGIPRFCTDLNNPQSWLKKWFGMNVTEQGQLVQTIPIGIANEEWAHGNKDALHKVALLDIPKDKLAYCNFDPNTKPEERVKLFHGMSDYPFITHDKQKQPFEVYLTNMAQYKYTIAPPGNSYDCHRIWEAIYLGVVPIVKKHVSMEYFYDLPILFVDDWSQLTEQFLNDEYENVKNKCTDKALFSHYKGLIHDNIQSTLEES